MQELAKFFNQCKLPSRVTPNGTFLWEGGENSDECSNIVHKKFYPISNYEIGLLAQQLRVCFPQWYRDFLSYCNGCSLFHGALNFFGMKNEYYNVKDDISQPCSLFRENCGRHKNIPSKWLFIGNYGFDGSEICIDAGSNLERVFCVRSMTDEVIRSWENLQEFIMGETNRLANLYGEKEWTADCLSGMTVPRSA